MQSNKEFNQSGITFSNIYIQGVGTNGVFIRSGATGSGIFKDVTTVVMGRLWT